MSSQQVTLFTLIEKWRAAAGQKRFEETQDEMESFFAEAKKIGATSQDIAVRRDMILGIWYPMTWREAQDRYEHWKSKPKYEQVKNSLVRLFADLIKSYFPEDFKKVEQSAVPKVEAAPSPVQKPADEDDMPIFDDPIDFLAHKVKRKA